MLPNLVTFEDWQTLKSCDLTKGFTNFHSEEIDKAVVFFDADLNYLDYLERKEVENIIPGYVLLPKFFWEMHNIHEEFMPQLRIPERIKQINEVYKSYKTSLETRSKTLIPLKKETQLREEQKPIIDFLLDFYNKNHKIQGILQAAPGVGKTAMSIYLASKLKTRTLIIVPNEVLQDQWIESILQFAELKTEEIGVIQGSDLKKAKEEIQKPICIIKIQSLFSQIKHNNINTLVEFYKNTELVVYDESHTSGAADSYAKTSSLFLTPNVFGLTATPYRTGLNDYLLKASIGGVIYKAEHQNLVPDVEIHNVWTEFSPNELRRLRSVGGDYIMMLGMFNAMMKSKRVYFEYLSDVVNYNHSRGHNIVILFATIALMENLQKQIQERHPHLQNKVLLLKGKTKADAVDLIKHERKKLMEEYKKYKEELDQKVKEKEIRRKEAQSLIKERRKEIDQKINYLKEHALDLYKTKVKEAEIIISNFNLLSAGFDKPQLSNIIFGGAPRIGKVSVIQSIGRVTRLFDGKLTPLVQYFIPSPFFEFHKSTSIILNKNIKLQYPEAKFKYIGFQNG